MNEESTYGEPSSEAGAYQAARDQTRQAVEEMRHAAEEKATQLKEAATARVQQIRTMAEEQAQQLREEASSQFHGVADESWDELKERTSELRVELEKYVRRNPTKSVLISFGVGMFLGMMFRR